MEGDVAESPVDCVSRYEVVQVLGEMKTGMDIHMYYWS